MSLYRDRGVVLRTYKLGEADRIVVMLTPGHGKVRAVAKGVRRTKSRIGGRLEPLSHVDLMLYEGRELDIVSQAETIEPWRPLHEDLDCLSQGMAMAEATEQVAQEREPSEPLYRMLVGALRALVDRPGPLVVASFYWKLLSLDGAGPILGSAPVVARARRRPASSPSTSAKAGRCAGTAGRASRSARWRSSCSAGSLGGQMARALQVPASAVTGEVSAPGHRLPGAPPGAAPAGPCTSLRGHEQLPASCNPRRVLRGLPGLSLACMVPAGPLACLHACFHGRTGPPVQSTGFRFPLGRDLRRFPLDLRLRAARGAHGPQREGRLVALHGPAAPGGGRPRRRHPVQPEDLGSLGAPEELHRPPGRLPLVQAALAGRQMPTTDDGKLKCPNCGSTDITEARPFNLMFKTFAGPVEDEGAVAYLRPETAQGHFVNFANVLQTEHLRPPFGTAQIGKSFRNEITPGNFVFRTREFEQMELEYFVPPGRFGALVRVLVQRAFRVVRAPRHPPGHAAPAPPHARGAVALLGRDRRRRVRLPVGLGRARGHRQPDRFRPEGPRRGQRAGARVFRPDDRRALCASCHRACRRGRPHDDGFPDRRLRPPTRWRGSRAPYCACTRVSRPTRWPCYRCRRRTRCCRCPRRSWRSSSRSPCATTT